jgi:hypothetical protein
MDVHTNAHWDAVLQAQCRVFTVAQAHRHGITEHRIRWQLRSGRWQRVHPRVYAAYSGPLTYESRLWAAVLYAGGGRAALCLQSAAYAWGLLDARPQTVHVLVAGSSKLVAAGGVRIHRTRRLTRADVYHSADPARTGVERTVLDLADRMGRPRDVCALLARAVRDGRTNGPRLAAAIERTPAVRHRRLLRELCELAAGGAQSLLEMRHATLGRDHGLPRPIRQAPYDRGGREGFYRLDALYEGYGIVVELDGRLVHTEPRQWWDDMDRDNRLQTSGLTVLRFPGFMVLGEPCRVAADLAAALRARGWTGVFRSCPACPRHAT